MFVIPEIVSPMALPRMPKLAGSVRNDRLGSIHLAVVMPNVVAPLAVPVM